MEKLKPATFRSFCNLKLSPDDAIAVRAFILKYFTEENDIVNRPSHYIGYYQQDGVTVEVQMSNVVKAFDLCFKLGSVLKYILRAGKKDKATEIEDLEKAKKYIEMKIEELRGL